MRRISWVSLPAALGLLVLFGAGASASGSSHKFTEALQLHLKAPNQIRPLVIYRKNILTVTNNTGRNWGRVKLTLTPATALVKTGSTPFKVTHLEVNGPLKTATWLIPALPAHESRSVKLAMRFPVVPKGVLPVFGISIEGQVLGGGPFNHIFVTMHYKKRAG